MIFAPIFGYMGDRFPRKYVMAVGIVIWSVMTYVGSLMNKDVSLLLQVFAPFDNFPGSMKWLIVVDN